MLIKSLIPADFWVKIKRNLEHGGDDETSSMNLEQSPKACKNIRGIRNQQLNRDHSDHSIVKIVNREYWKKFRRAEVTCYLSDSSERSSANAGVNISQGIIIIMYRYQPNGQMSKVFANGLRDWGSILGRIIPKTHKMVLDAALLNTQYYKVRINSKAEQSREWSSDLPYTSV